MAKALPQSPRLYLDEHLSPELAEALRRRGLDAVACLEIAMNEKDDDIQFEFAVGQRRALVTVNHRDYVPLHQQWLDDGKEHWGLILTTEEEFKVYFRRLMKLVHTLAADDLVNQCRWLNEFK